VTAWGYATSSGLKSMDYFLADEVVVPTEERELYVENVVYLPCLVNHYSPEKFPAIVEPPCLTTDVFTFGSFNRLAKISDQTFEVWAEILKEVPNSRLLISINENDYKASQERIVNIFKSHGVPGTRLFFRGRVGWTEFMLGYNHVDCVLDAWPHSGGLSCVDSLKMAVPVITYKHPTIVGRLSSSILHAVGLDDWIANTIDEYKALAVKWSNDKQGLKELRAVTREKFDNSIVGDCRAYVKAVEYEYTKMWDKYVDSKLQKV
jgi:predicted O-linked N-acetylglucosamine transferase (SPINDLY family)